MNQDAWNPQQYEKFKDQRSQPFFDLMHLLQPKALAKVADLGCGTGELTAELHRFIKAEETLGLDSSEEMLKKAQAFATPSLQFQFQDILKWQSREGFDIIFSNAALQWCENHPALFAQIKKNLRADGQLAVQMPMNHDYPTHVIAQAMSREEPWASMMSEPYEKQKSMMSVEEYASLLFRLGFKEQKVFLNVYPHVLNSREDVIEWVQGSLLTYFKARMQPADFTLFVAEFQRRLFLQLPDDKPFFYPFKRILMWARA